MIKRRNTYIKRIVSGVLLLVSSMINAQEQPNIIMIVLDDLNDYVGVMGGHPQAQTPNIDRLAGEGVLFTNAHSNCPVCMPSRASFMTGILPTTSGVWGFDNWLKNEMLVNSKTLPEYARDNGYATYQTSKVLHNTKKGAWDEMGVPAEYGPLAWDGEKAAIHPSCPEEMDLLGPLDATFAPLSDVPSVKATGDAPGYNGWYNTKYNHKGPFRYVSEEDRDLMTDEKSVQWLKNKMAELERGNNDKPFFIGFGIIRPHTPLVVPQKYFDQFPLEEVKIPVYLENDAEDTGLEASGDKNSRGRTAFKALTGAYDTPEEGLRRYIQAYLASVSFADDIVGGVLDILDDSSFKENTVVVLFSDHGYNMGEKDYLFKYCLWEETTRVPLIIRHPDYKANAGKTVEHPVSLVDVFPTIAEIGHMKGTTMENEKGAPLDGHSLIPFIANPETTNWEGPDVALTVIASWKSKKSAEQHLSVRSKDFRYIRYYGGYEELYNHRTDGYEWDNLADDKNYQSVKADLNRQLDQLLIKKNKSSSGVKKQPVEEKNSNEAWKDKYFKMHPEADTNGDGVLSWPEYKAHKGK